MTGHASWRSRPRSWPAETGSLPPVSHRFPIGATVVALAILAFLAAFLILPVGSVFYSAFVNADGSFTLGHFAAFFSQLLMLEAFLNSLHVAIMSALVAALIAVPLAYFTVRFRFRGAI